jgi:hypothetical protein
MDPWGGGGVGVGTLGFSTKREGECTYSAKVKLSLCFNWAPRHEGVLGEWRHSSTHSLTSALDGGEWSASGLGRFTPRERAPGTHWIRGWVGPRAVLDAMVKKKDIQCSAKVLQVKYDEWIFLFVSLAAWKHPRICVVQKDVIQKGKC